MRALTVLLAIVACPLVTDARPRADVVLVWAPGAHLAPVEAAARDAGAALIDRSPAARPPFATAQLISRAITAYDALQLDEAAQLLAAASAEVDGSGAADLTQAELSDLFLYRGLIAHQRGDATAAWDELVLAVTAAPARVLDPARFPPRVAAELERVRSTVASRPTALLGVEAPAGCTLAIDGVVAGRAATPRVVGPHWANVRCPDRAPWGARIDLIADTTLTAATPVLVPPSLDEALIQARTAGARAFVLVEVTAGIAQLRLIGLDGRERDRRTVGVRTSLAPAADALTVLLAATAAPRWYQSRWVWATGAAVLAAAILVPITAAASRDTTPTTWTVRPDGIPAW